VRIGAEALNEAQVFADLDAFVRTATTVAIPRALNKLRDQARTAGFRKIADVYSIGPRTMDQYTTVNIASINNPQATITVKGRGFPLSAFQPRQVRGGVTVLLKGRRVLIPHAFIGRMRTGHVGVFARGVYGSKGDISFRPTGETFGRFTFGRRRLPISELFTFGPAETLRNRDVQDAMDARVREQSAKVIQQEIRFATRH